MIIVLLILNGAVRYAALVLSLSFVFYAIFILNLSGEYYYAACAGLELLKGFLLNKKYRLVSYLCYLLILINYSGWVLYEFSYDPFVYDILCSVILIMQVALLIMQGLLNGVNRSYRHIFVVRLINFDSGQARGTMFKNKATKKTDR